MKVTFKNVGQGDTIIFDWQENGIHQIGIIDCRKCNKENPVINYIENLLENKMLVNVAFIILSHPHIDHFSGMPDLLDYLKRKGINIYRFCHTICIHKKYLNWANISDDDNSLLERLIKKAILLKDSGQIQKIIIISEEWGAQLNDRISVCSLGPSDDECRLYTQRVDGFNAKNDEIRASREANLLSSILLFRFGKSYFILSSDATIEAIDRIRIRGMFNFEQANLKLAQIPHHGSKDNHRIEFWRNLQYDTNCPAVISAGSHQQYKHPHKQVIKDFDDNNFRIHSTNNINGITDFMTEKEINNTSALDMISSGIERYELEGDQVFHIIGDEIIYSVIN